LLKKAFQAVDCAMFNNITLEVNNVTHDLSTTGVVPVYFSVSNDFGYWKSREEIRVPCTSSSH
jgi:hypothetical protein